MKNGVIKMAAFLRKHHEPCRYWPKQNLVGWLRWMVMAGAVACVTRNGRVTGVGIARPVLSLEQARDHYAMNHGGTILFVDLAAATDEQSTALLLRQARTKWGERVLIAFYRNKWARHDVLPWRDFMSRFTRKEYSYGR